MGGEPSPPLASDSESEETLESLSPDLSDCTEGVRGCVVEEAAVLFSPVASSAVPREEEEGSGLDWERVTRKARQGAGRREKRVVKSESCF